MSLVASEPGIVLRYCVPRASNDAMATALVPLTAEVPPMDIWGIMVVILPVRLLTTAFLHQHNQTCSIGVEPTGQDIIEPPQGGASTKCVILCMIVRAAPAIFPPVFII